MTETAIEPELAICDAHHHLGDESHLMPYSIEEFAADGRAGHCVTRSVYIEYDLAHRQDGPEAMRVVGETEHVAAVALRSAEAGGPDVAAIVAAADLLGEDLEDVLRAHEAAAGGRFRGIRARVAHDPSRTNNKVRPDLLGDPAFRAGAATIGAMGLCLDVWAYHHQLPDVVDMVRAVPQTTMVVNHIGGPLGIGSPSGAVEVEPMWRRSVEALAACPNVTMKLGGIGMALMGYSWREDGATSSDEIAAAAGGHLRFAIDAFGPSRCMFESNFPVDRFSFDYVTLWNAFKKISVGYSREERQALLHDTAVSTYRLGRRGSSAVA